jgi:hypothetical protein
MREGSVTSKASVRSMQVGSSVSRISRMSRWYGSSELGSKRLKAMEETESWLLETTKMRELREGDRGMRCERRDRKVKGVWF